MTDVFISYARSDRKIIAPLAEILSAKGYSVWWDHDIAGGAAFAAEIVQALRRASCVIVAWSIKSIQSEWVIDEAGVAKQDGKLVPIQLDASPAPLGFRQFQTIKFAQWNGAADAPEIIELEAGLSRFQRVEQTTTPQNKSEQPANTQFADAIAVLPLENLTGSSDQQFLADGLHEAIIIELSKIENLKVVSRTSAKRFGGADLSLREIAAQLGVAKIVEGSVMRSGSSLRISVQLSDAKSDTLLWADSFDRDETDILKLHKDVASKIAQGTSVALTPEDRSRFGAAGKVNTESYEAYLKGMYHWYKLSPEDMQHALENFETSLSLDSNFAPAYAGIAAVWAGVQQMGVSAPRIVAPKIKEAAERALELDSGLFQSHFVWGTYQTWSGWNWDIAETAFQRAIDLNPNFPDTHAYYSHLLNIVGRLNEARAAIEKAINVDPFNPLIRALYGVDLLMWGKFEESIAEFSDIQKAAPDHWLPLQAMRFAYSEMGETEKVLETNRQLYRLLNRPSVVASIDHGYENGGYEAAMTAAAEELVRLNEQAYVAPTQIVMLFGLGNEIEKAADWVETAFEERDPDMPYIKHMYWITQEQKRHPRIAKIIEKMNYPEE